MSEQEAWTMVNKIAKLIEERDALVAELANATKLALDHQLCEARILAAEAEVERLQEASRSMMWLREVIGAKDDLLVAHRTGNHSKADKALAKLEKLAKENA